MSIQDAIDAAADGDEIHLSAEMYTESFDFSGKSLNIVGKKALTKPGLTKGDHDVLITANDGEVIGLFSLGLTNAFNQGLVMDGVANLHEVNFAGLGSNEDFGGALAASSAEGAIADQFIANYGYDGAGIHA